MPKQTKKWRIMHQAKKKYQEKKKTTGKIKT